MYLTSSLCTCAHLTVKCSGPVGINITVFPLRLILHISTVMKALLYYKPRLCCSISMWFLGLTCLLVQGFWTELAQTQGALEQRSHLTCWRKSKSLKNTTHWKHPEESRRGENRYLGGYIKYFLKKFDMMGVKLIGEEKWIRKRPRKHSGHLNFMSVCCPQSYGSTNTVLFLM